MARGCSNGLSEHPPLSAVAVHHSPIRNPHEPAYFLRQSATAATASLSIPYFVPSHVLAAPGRRGANDRVKVGFIGCGGRGRHLMSAENLKDHADIIAVADCFAPRMDEAAKIVPGSQRWAKYQDYRKMLEKEKLDAVFVPTTTHARALAVINAMQAGCDVNAREAGRLTIAEGGSWSRPPSSTTRCSRWAPQRTMPSNVSATDGPGRRRAARSLR